MQFIFGFLIVLLFLWLLRDALKTASPKKKQSLIYVALGVAGLVVVLLAVSGRLHFLAAGLAALWLWGRRLLGGVSMLRTLAGYFGSQVAAGAGSSPGHESHLDTSLLRMTLDHTTGRMDGQVLQGKYTGQLLSAMNLGHLQELYDQCCGDYPDALEVLETYLERTLGEDWRKDFQSSQEQRTTSTQADMTVGDACEILNLSVDAEEKEIVEAHRRLMQKFHPDRGGSNFLAAKINEAKDVLLRHCKKA